MYHGCTVITSGDVSFCHPQVHWIRFTSRSASTCSTGTSSQAMAMSSIYLRSIGASYDQHDHLGNTQLLTRIIEAESVMTVSCTFQDLYDTV